MHELRLLANQNTEEITIVLDLCYGNSSKLLGHPFRNTSEPFDDFGWVLESCDQSSLAAVLAVCRSFHFALGRPQLLTLLLSPFD